MPGVRAHARRLVVVTAAAVCLPPASPAARQRPSTQPQPTFRAGIELVQIDAVVVDGTGAHVRGLTAGDFVIRDRGKPQAIAAFEEVTHRRPPREDAGGSPPALAPLDVAGNQTAASERLVVLVIDDLHIWRGRTETARSIARGILDRLGPDASMAVLFTSGDRGTQVTTDRALLTRAIESLDGRQSVRRPHQAVDMQRTGRLDPEGSMEDALAAIRRSQDTSLQQFADNMRLFKALEDAARIMGAGDARRKAFVLLSEGLAKNPTGIFGMMNETPQAPIGGAQYAATGDASATMATRPVSYHDLALVDMMESMRRFNVAAYAIDPRGEVTSEELALELHPEPIAGDPIFRWNNSLRQAQDGLETIAGASGGFAVVNTDDFSSGLERIIDDLDHYYLLGFYPQDAKGNDFRPLDVRVPAHPEWTIRFRRGYKPHTGKNTGISTDPLVALSAGVLPKSDLRLRAGAVVLASEGARETRLALTLEVSAPRAAMQDPDGRLRDELTYDILAVDETHKTVKRAGGLKARATLSPTGGNAPDIATYQVADTIALPPGRYQLRVAARSTRLNKGGSVYLNVEVPDLSRAPIFVGGLAIGYAGGERVAEARAGSRLTPALPFAATLDRAFRASDVLRVCFDAALKGTAGPVPGRLEVLAADGAPRSSLDFLSDDRGRVDLALPLGNLSAGKYLLRATIQSGPQTGTREIAFTVR